MNRDQVKGTAKDVLGKVQRKIGEATGDASQQIKGGAKQVEGKLQRGAGDVLRPISNPSLRCRGTNNEYATRQCRRQPP